MILEIQESDWATYGRLSKLDETSVFGLRMQPEQTFFESYYELSFSSSNFHKLSFDESSIHASRNER